MNKKQMYLIEHPEGYDPQSEEHESIMMQRRLELLYMDDKHHLIEILESLLSQHKPFS